MEVRCVSSSRAGTLALTETATAFERWWYDDDPRDPDEFTWSFDRFYSRFAPLYDVAVK
jgi:hypothetical protein